jgi:hypothetical protein
MRYIRGPFGQTLEKWDELASQRRVVGIGGADAHAKVVIPLGLVKIFPYEDVFKTVQTVVLCPRLAQNFEKARATLYGALGEGHCYFANALIGEPSGFRFFAELPSGEVIIQGDETDFVAGTVLRVINPQKAEMKLLCNGKVVAESKMARFSCKAEKAGAYRVELRVGGAPFLFSNHIYLLK